MAKIPISRIQSSNVQIKEVVTLDRPNAKPDETTDWQIKNIQLKDRNDKLHNFTARVYGSFAVVKVSVQKEENTEEYYSLKLWKHNISILQFTHEEDCI